MTYVPLFVNADSLDVLIVGGGKVATKRTLEYLKMGARVTVLTLEASNDIRRSAARVIEGNGYDLTENGLKNFNLVITATNDKKLNERICDMAKKMKVICNNPTSPEHSNCIFPIHYYDKNFSIAITTYGKSSLVAKLLLDKIKTELYANEYIVNLLDTMYNVKLTLKEKEEDPSTRYRLYHVIFEDQEFQSSVKKGDKDSAMKRAEEIINGTIGQ
ncbi:siroheme synthase [Sulfolobales archaeon HS-7]|nr:siroheme synthase [Sulfolobales archaeon HS-7]